MRSGFYTNASPQALSSALLRLACYRAASCLLLAGVAMGQVSNSRPGEEGIPVTEALVITKCERCHARDEKGNMQRISWARGTPEGWQAVLKRMILSQGVSLTAPEARVVVRYLSGSHGLAPDEARPVMYNAERRIREETNIPNDRLRNACAKCHAFAVPLSWRRSAVEWRAFLESHAKRNSFPPNAEAAAFLAEAAPLHSPAWDEWRSQTSHPQLTGRWLVSASAPGRGKYYGEMQVDPAGEDEFTTRVQLTSVKDGSKLTRSGRTGVYGGYAWRGRSSGGAPASATPDAIASEAREVMWIAADRSAAEGRWFWGQYQEFGIDVQLRRVPATAALMIVDRSSMKIGSEGNRVRLIGRGFAASTKREDLDFGPGTKVRQLISATDTEIVAEVDVAPDAPLGKRAVGAGPAVLPGAMAIYDHIDYLKVTPESAVAAFGDRTHPRGYLQFEAVGYQRGADGKAHTDDDVDLGVFEATWSLQVFHAAEESSANSVGAMNDSGLLTPAADNPGNNFDCWVTATARGEPNRNGMPLVGKSYVVVTVPTYAFNGRQYVRDLDRWVDDGPAPEGHR